MRKGTTIGRREEFEMQVKEKGEGNGCENMCEKKESLYGRGKEEKKWIMGYWKEILKWSGKEERKLKSEEREKGKEKEDNRKRKDKCKGKEEENIESAYTCYCDLIITKSDYHRFPSFE